MLLIICREFIIIFKYAYISLCLALHVQPHKRTTGVPSRAAGVRWKGGSISRWVADITIPKEVLAAMQQEEEANGKKPSKRLLELGSFKSERQAAMYVP